jgi:hypothetical protein
MSVQGHHLLLKSLVFMVIVGKPLHKRYTDSGVVP